MSSEMMESWQVLEWGKPLQRVISPRLQPSGTEVLVKVKACGVCHSDVHLRDGFYDMGAGERIELERIGIGLPLTLGHEILATVAQVGPDAPTLASGLEGVVFPWIGCGHCRHCKTDREIDCETPISLGTRRPGGYGQYMLVPHPRYFVPCEGVDPLVAATASCSGVTAFSALKKLPNCRDGDTLVLLGAGGLGLAALGQIRHVHPKARVVMVDADPAKLQFVRSQADATVNSRDPDSHQVLREIAQGGVSGVIDFVGVPDTFAWSLKALRKGGSLVVVGLFGGGVHLSLPLLPMRNLKIIGSYVGSLAEFHELMQLLRERKVQSVPVLTRPVSEINHIFDDIARGKVNGRVVVVQ